MSEIETGVTPVNSETTLEQSVIQNAPADNDSVKTVPDSIPYARFKEVNDALKEMRSAYDNQVQSQKQAELKRLEDEGKTLEVRDLQLKELQEKLTLYEPLAKEYTNYQERRTTSWLEQLGEDKDSKTILQSLPFADRRTYMKQLTNKNEVQAVVPNVSSDKPGSNSVIVDGYTTPQQAAYAFSRGELKKNDYEKIINKFSTSRIKGW
jgi:hypothetical protein